MNGKHLKVIGWFKNSNFYNMSTKSENLLGNTVLESPALLSALSCILPIFSLHAVLNTILNKILTLSWLLKNLFNLSTTVFVDLKLSKSSARPVFLTH